jgi:hypothetical protein
MNLSSRPEALPTRRRQHDSSFEPWLQLVLRAAFRSGSVPEVVDDSVTGFVADPNSRPSKQLNAWATSTALACARFEERFLARRMAEE